MGKDIQPRFTPPLPHMHTTAVLKLIANASFHDLTQSSQMDGSTGAGQGELMGGYYWVGS